MRNAPSASNHAQPTRNASVPAPPLRPVVSRSRKTNGARAGAPPASSAASSPHIVQSLGEIANARASMLRRRLPAPLDDEAGAAICEPPFAAEGGQVSGLGIRVVRRAKALRHS